MAGRLIQSASRLVTRSSLIAPRRQSLIRQRRWRPSAPSLILLNNGSRTNASHVDAQTWRRKPTIYGPPSSGGGGYVAKAVHIENDPVSLATASLTASGDTTGYFSCSIWFKNTDTNAVMLGGQAFQCDAAGNFTSGLSLSESQQSTTPTLQPYFVDPTGSDYYTWNPATDSPTLSSPDNNWHNILISAQTNHPDGSKILQFYLDDIANNGANPPTDGHAAFTMAFNGLSFGVFSSAGNPSIAQLDAADWWFAPGQFIDFSVTANRRKFISAGGKPVSLGATGSLPTGTAPAVFFSGDKSTFGTNKGTGGAFTLTVKLFGFGSNGAGPCTLTNATVGQTVIQVYDTSTSTDVSSDFEATITVNDEIQQTGSADYSADTLQVTLSGGLTNASSSPSN